MMGKKNGAATHIKNDIQSIVLSTHCHIQSLNLAFIDWIRNTAVVSKNKNQEMEA